MSTKEGGKSYDWRRYYVAMVSVRVTSMGKVRHLRVWKRSLRDGITWDRLQQIKNELLGEDVTAIEVYPQSYHLIYEENMRHLFEWPTDRCPFDMA